MGRNAARRRALKPKRRPIVGQYEPVPPAPERLSPEARAELASARSAVRPELCPRCRVLGWSEPHKVGDRHVAHCRYCGQDVDNGAIERWVRGALARLPLEVLDRLFESSPAGCGVHNPAKPRRRYAVVKGASLGPEMTARERRKLQRAGELGW